MTAATRAVVGTITVSSSCSRRRRSSCSAVRAASARRRSRPPPRSAPRAGSAARCSCSRSIRPGASRPRSASKASATARTRCRPRCMKAAGVEPRGELWAAMLDTKQSWDDLVLRHAKDEETAYRILENRLYHNLTARFVQSHDYIAMERLYEIHAGGEYDLIVIDTPPTRNAIDFLEAPGPHGRVLRRPACCAGSRCRTASAASAAAACSTSRAGPSTRWPTASSAASSSRTSPSSSSTSSRCTTASSHARRRSSSCCTTAARRSRSSRRSRRRRCTRPSDSATSSSTREVPPRRARAQQDAARLPARSRPVPTRGDRVRRRRRRDRRGVSLRSGTRRSTTRRRSPACCARSASRSATSPSSRCGRRSCEPSSHGFPTWSCASRTSRSTSATSTGSRRSAVTCSVEEARRVTTVPDLARLAHRAGRRRPRAGRAAGRDLAFARRPLVLRPAAARADRAARRAIGSSCSRRSGRSPARRTTRRISSAASSTRSNARCSRAAGGPARSSKATRTALGAKDRVRVKCIPMRTHGRLDRGADAGVADLVHAPRRRARTRVPRGVRSLRRDDRRGLVPVPGRRDGSGERAARRRRRDRHRRRDPRRGSRARTR